MSSAVDYRDSHQSEGKGTSYDCGFLQRKLRRYIWSWEQDVLREILGRFLSQVPAIDYLDFACGTGRILSFLEDRVSTACGVDVSDTMLDVARQRVQKSTLFKADITQSDPFGEQRFDLITAFRFFLNAQPSLRDQAMVAIGKRLKSQGYLVFNVHMNHSCLLAKLVRTKRRLLRRDPYALNTISRSEAQRLAGLAGLKVIQTYHRGFLPFVNEDTKFPIWAIHPLEALASCVPAMEPWSRYVVYVCQAQSG